MENDRSSVARVMRRKIFRRRTLAFLVLGCFLLYISGKILHLQSPTDVDVIYQALASNLHLTGEAQKYHHQHRRVSQNGRRPRVTEVDCAAVFRGDQAEIDEALNTMNDTNFTRNAITELQYIEDTRDCDAFKAMRGYNFYNVTEEEKNFPIAYSILLYKDVEQAERLLRALYTPQNYFCFHVDMDAKFQVHKAIQQIADCFDNVFVVSKKEYIVYAGFTRLQADLNCMQDLIQNQRRWYYFINLPSQEFPLKTNAELVKILSVYNGANDIEGLTGHRRLQGRFQFKYLYKRGHDKTKPRAFKTKIEKEPPPWNITVVKGSAYGIFSRPFVEFVVNGKFARELLDWFREVLSPDEYYWATLQYNPEIGVPGSYYTGKPDDKPWLAAYALWGGEGRCHGKFVHGVCVFGVGDLQNLKLRKELFVNKFHIDHQPYALDCIEEWHYNKTVNPSLSRLNMTYYSNLPFIKKKDYNANIREIPKKTSNVNIF